MDRIKSDNNKRREPSTPPSYTLPKNLLLSRGISKVQANEELLNEARIKIETNMSKKSHDSTNKSDTDDEYDLSNEFEYTSYSFMLPDLNKFDDYNFKEFLQTSLIDINTQANLSKSGHLNWWTLDDWEHVNRPLYVMATTGDGNCLLHAASLAMWGVHDRHLILRKALHNTLKNIKEDNSNALWRRWKWEQMCQNRKCGLIYSEEEWSSEWNSLLRLSSTQPRHSAADQKNSSSSSSLTQENNGNSYNNGNNHNGAATVYFESLEEFHVFLLAFILQRPIIIIAETILKDSKGDPLSPIPFGGIYLPFECEIDKCHRFPLVLAYDSAHFSALVLMDDEDYNIDLEENIENRPDTLDDENYLKTDEIHKINKKLQSKPPYSIIPLTYSNKTLLPIHFAYDPGASYDWSKFPSRDNQTPPSPPPPPPPQANTINESTDNMSVSSQNGSQPQHFQPSEATLEQSLDDKMYLLQTYLDLVKLELYDPGPLLKRAGTQNVAINSSGMCASIVNIHVNEPLRPASHTTPNNNNNNDSKLKPYKTNNNNNTRQSVNNKIQKFLSIFKRDNNSNTYKTKKTDNNAENNKSNKNESKLSIFSGKLRSSIRGNNNNTNQSNHSVDLNSEEAANGKNKSTTLPSKLKSTSTLNSLNNQTFHKLMRFKNWSILIDTLNTHPCLLGVKLNLAKPPKYKLILSNYIDSALSNFEEIKYQKKIQQSNPQQQQLSKNEYFQSNNNRSSDGSYFQCQFGKNDCCAEKLCANCYLLMNGKSGRSGGGSVRASVLGNSSNNFSHHSYNTSGGGGGGGSGGNRRSFGDHIANNEVTSFYQL